jgi:hypothetical protein
METEITYLSNDTVRGIEQLINHINKWRDEGGNANPRETALVLTKLEEARFWALDMIDRKG